MQSGSTDPLKWHRTVATAVSILTILYGCYSIWRNFVAPPGVDFVAHWAAGQLVNSGHPALPYDIQVHRAAELTAGPVKGLLPFPYPPPFLFVTIPLALLPFPVALAFWLVVTGTFYVLAIRKFLPLRFSLAVPPALPTALIGQNAFLTTGLMAAGLSTMARRPFLGGAILGLLIIKPQLGLLLPFALLAGREWKAIGGATASVLIALAAAALAFGLPTYQAFLEIIPVYGAFIHEQRWPWSEMASVFAALRHLGVTERPALLVHCLIAVAVVAYTCRAWAKGSEHRFEILAAGTLLIPPYLFTYDSLLIALPLGSLVRSGRSGPVALVWILCLLPILGLAGFYPGPNTIPLAALCCLAFLGSKSKRAPAADT